jgi:hypothetical protein
MTGPIAGNRDVESLKTAARWPGADRATVVTLATRLAADGADGDGYSYFQQEADAHPDQVLLLAARDRRPGPEGCRMTIPQSNVTMRLWAPRRTR